MRTIEERARDFVDAPCDHRCKNCKTVPADCRFYNDQMSFIAGAESEHDELTRWNDPHKPPVHENRVIVQAVLPNGALFVTGGWYAINEFPEGWSVDLNDRFENLSVIGWREIY